MAETGFISGYGFDLRELDYAPIILTGNISWKIAYTTEEPNVKQGLFIQLEPMVSYVPRKTVDELEYGFKPFIGINIQIQKVIPYLMMGSGPIYLSVKDIPRQAGGLAFATAWVAGSKFQMKSNQYLNLQLRHRHISNAGLEVPNAGIDNFFILIGWSWYPTMR